jgi:hypothetical protein
MKPVKISRRRIFSGRIAIRDLTIWLVMLGLAGCSLAACSKKPPQPGRSAPQPGILFTSDRDGNWEIYRISRCLWPGAP